MTPGSKLGSLTLIRRVEPPRFIRKREAWGLFRCDCGREKQIRLASVTGGYSRSCGCASQKAMRGMHQALLNENVR